MFKITQSPGDHFGRHSVRDYSFLQNCLIITSKGAIPGGLKLLEILNKIFLSDILYSVMKKYNIISLYSLVSVVREK